MQTIEQQAYNILSEKNYTLSIAGEQIEFRQATLDDLQKMSVIISKLPVLDEIEKTEDNLNEDIPQLIQSLEYARSLGDILMVTAEINVVVDLDKDSIKGSLFKSKEDVYEELYRRVKSKKGEEEQKRIERIIYQKASSIDIWVAVQEVIKNNHLFFYQNTITFLKGMNQLKPTKGINQTVLGA